MTSVPLEQSPAVAVEHRPVSRLAAVVEMVLAYVVFQLLTLAFLPALRDRTQTFVGDVLVNGIGPDQAGAADYLKSGTFPSWARDSYGGVPYTANIQHAVFFPGNAPFLFLRESLALEVVVATTVAFGAWAMYLYARFALRTRVTSALLAGLAFGFGGMSLEHVVLTNQLQAIAVMPLVLLALHKTLVSARLRDVVFLALAIGFHFLAGHPEEWVYTLIAVALYGVVWALASATRDVGGSLRQALAGGVRVVGGIGLFALLFGFQLFPTLLLKGQSYRESADFKDQFPLPRAISANALLPDYGHRLIGENVGFVGIAVLAVAALGLVARRPGLRWVKTWVVAISVLGFVMALGRGNAFATFANGHLPLLSSFRVPSRFLLLPTFGFAALAALGLDSLLDESTGLSRRALLGRLRLGALAALALGVGTAFALTVGGGSGPQDSLGKWALAALVAGAVWLLASWRAPPRVLLAVVVLAVTTVELEQARPQGAYHEVAPDAVYDDSGATLSALDTIGGRYVTRVGDPRPGDTIAVPAGLTGRQADYYRAYRRTKIAARFNQQSVLHVETPLGRDGGLVPFRTYKEFMDRRLGVRGNFVVGNYPEPPSDWDYDTLDFLAVRNFVTYPLEPAEQAVLKAHGFSQQGSYDYAQVWTRAALPLAHMVYDVRVVSDPVARIGALSSVQLSQQAVLEAPVPALSAPPSVPAVTTTLQDAGQVTSTVTTPTRGLLVLADPAYPQWTVTVDGKPASLLRVDHAFQGVVLEPGAHRVVFRYVDHATTYGAGLAALTLLGLVVVTPVVRRVRRRPSPSDED